MNAIERGRISGFSLAMLALALIMGGYLRFADIGGREMSADEGASWAAASAPTIREVLIAQNHLNPGKAGLHDVALHLWMRAFGNGLSTMRALSATIVTLSILLVFGASREILAASCETASDDAVVGQSNDVAAIAAIVFAVNLITIKYSREVRMYPFVIAAVVAQTWCFFRALRIGGLAAYAGVAIFTAMALAAHLTAVLAFSGEGLWLAWLIAKNRFDFSATKVRRAFTLMLALTAGVAMLAPLVPAVVGSAARAADRGAIDWIKRPEPGAPFALFNKATGTLAFPLLVALAAWGVAHGWRRWQPPIKFSLLWMWAPPLLLMIVSYLIRPAFVERYLLSCFVPFFLLVAIGITELPTQRIRIAATALVAVFAIGHVVAWNRKDHDVQWREAVGVALKNSKSGDTLAVAPGFADSVVRYYLAENSATVDVHRANASANDSANVVLVADQGVAPATTAAFDREYPRALAHLRGVVVRGR